VQQIMRFHPAARILIVTSYEMEEDIFQIMQAGASGYLLKDMGREVLFEAIFAVHGGKRWVPERIASRLAERTARRDLTPRELEIAHFIVRGLTNHEIGSVLSISDSTVKNHMYSLLAKLEVADRTEAAAFCLTRGIVKMDEL
jgi:DNA-binding NarL/FixJ family response regulator